MTDIKKLEYSNIIKSRLVYEQADLIAIKLEHTNEYYIIKNRNSEYHKTKLNYKTFKEALMLSTKPIVMSDSYIDMSKFETE